MTKSIPSPNSVGKIRQQKEAQILEAAEIVFAQFGYSGASTSKIAELAKIPKANLHYYFPTKVALYKTILSTIFQEWTDTHKQLKVHKCPREALTHYIREKMAFSRHKPLGSRIWVNEMLNGAPFGSEFIAGPIRIWVEEWLSVYQLWIDKGKLPPSDPKVVLYMIWATTQHYADFSTQIELLNNNQKLTDEEYEYVTTQVIQIILRGIGLV